MAAAIVSDAAKPDPVHRTRSGVVLLIILAVLLALAIVVRLVLDPIASYETRKALGNMEGLRGDFAHVHVTVFAPSYEITNLKLMGQALWLSRAKRRCRVCERATCTPSLQPRPTSRPQAEPSTCLRPSPPRMTRLAVA